MSDHTTNESTNEIPYGYCHCGCGQKTKIATKTSKRDKTIKGQPTRFINGHYNVSHDKLEPQNPTSLCMCGCGQVAPIARITSTRQGYRKGDSMRFLPGHGNQIRERNRLPVDRFWANVDKGSKDECWNYKANLDLRGYGRLKVNRKTVRVHRFSYELHYGQIPQGLYVCHSCDNPSCVNPAHLWLGTQSDNMKDCAQKDRQGRLLGETNPSAKLSETLVLEIRQSVASGARVVDVANNFNISVSLVYQIIRREVWGHIE